MTAETIQLKPEEVEQIIKQSASSSEAVIAVYKLVYPHWSAIAKVEGHPLCNSNTWHSICLWIQGLDERMKAKCLPGGIWMNCGFSSAESKMPALELADWEILPAKVTYL